MSFERLHKLVTYLYASLGLLVVATSVSLPLLPSVMVAILVALSAVADGPFIATRRYQRLHTLGLFAVLAFEGVALLRGADLFTSLVRATMVITISRLFQRRSAAEHQQIAALALVELTIGSAIDTGLVYAVAFFGFVVLTPWMMALTHLRGEIERKYGATGVDHAPGETSPELERARAALRSRELATPRFLLGSAALALPLFLVTALFFVLFPRVGSGFLDVRARGGERVAGFGGEVELGSFGTIRDDPTVVIRVFTGDGARAPRRFRLRGTSFDTYDGARWSHGGARVRLLPSAYGYHVLRRPRDPDRDPALRIQAEPLDGPIAFLPEHTIAVRFSHDVVRGRATAPDAILAEGGELRLRDERAPAVIYDAILDHHRQAYDVSLDAGARARMLAIPPGHERVVALARRIAGDAATDAARVDRVVRYLRDGDVLRYDLTQDDPGEVPPLVHFLFTSRRGHCEYFATALAIMLRGLGIPTRNVTGFLGGAPNPFADFYGIRQGDAHSWVEAYVDGAFRTYDPTPAARDAYVVEAPGPFALLRAALDAARARWASDVVGFDFDRQAEVLRALVPRRDRTRGLADAPDRDAPDRDARGDTGRPLIALALVVALFGLALAVRRARRRGPKPPEIVRLYEALDHALARRGHARPPSRSPRAHLEALEAAGFAPLDVVREITELYARVRYTPGATSTVDRATLARLRRATRAISRRR